MSLIPPIPMHVPYDAFDGNGTVRGKDMLAIRTKSACAIKIEDAKGKLITANIAKGTLGFLIRNEGNESFVELVKGTGELSQCRLPTNVLETGVANSEFKILLPGLQAANVAAPVANSRADQPAGKAIRTMWENIQRNKEVLQQYGLRADVYDDIMSDETKRRRTLNAILASFDHDAWRILNTPGIPVRDFLRLRQMEPKWPKLENGEAVIYLRLYYDNVNSNHFGKYVGQTTRQYPHQRQKEHEAMLNDPSKPGSHYLEARKYQFCHASPIMKLKDVGREVVAMAEMTLCSLLHTWNPRVLALSQQGISNEALAATLPSKLLVSALSNIAEGALRRVNFPQFPGTGCNWGCPLQEMIYEKRQWTMYRVTSKDRREMSVYRCQSHVAVLQSGGTTGNDKGLNLGFCGGSINPADGTRQWKGFYIQARLDHLPGIRVGLPLIVSIELMEDGEPHVDPWFRHPYHGAWDNSHELHSFCVKVEWMDESTNTWYTTSVQHRSIVQAAQSGTWSGAPVTVTPAWRKATMILQFLLNRRYRNPPSWINDCFRPNIRQMNYDHLQQTISFSPIPEKPPQNPPAHVSFEHNYQELLRASQNKWPAVTIGRKPPADWFHRYGKGPKDTACLICRIGSNLYALEVYGCAKRQAFTISPNEPHSSLIREGSCNACWKFWRRPCVWAPLEFGRVAGEPYNPQYPKIPPEYKGIAPEYFRESTATEIWPPLSIEDYFNILEEQVLEESNEEGLIPGLEEANIEE